MIEPLLKKLPPAAADFIWSLPGMAERAPVLALAHDGFALYGLVATRQGKQVSDIGRGQSRAVSFAAALGEVLAQLRAQRCVLPRRAVLATAGAIPALLELPVEGEAPKPIGEMLGLVRWELEPLMAEQIGLWSLGALLQGRGCLNASARAQIAAEVAQRRAEAGRSGPRGGQPSARFGEMAIELGLAQREQVEECLALQTQLQSIDDQVVCAWVPRGLPTEGGRSLWLAAGIGLAVQTRWIDACKRHGLRLEAIVPLATAALPGYPAQAAVVEVHAAQIVALRVRDGLPARLALQARDERPLAEAIAALLTELLEPDDRAVTLVAALPLAAELAADLAARLGRPVHMLADDDPTPGSARPPCAAAMLGAAHAVLGADRHLLPRLPGSAPLPPALKRPQTWAAAGLLGFALLAVGYELSAWARMLWLRNQISQLTGSKAEQQKGKAMAEEAKAKSRDVLSQADKLKQETAAAEAELRFYRDELGGRSKFTATVFDALPGVIGGEVVLDALIEDKWFELAVSGWSVSQPAAYRFAKDLAHALAEWRFEVRDINVKAQTGRSGKSGYSLQFRLVRLPPAAAGPNATEKKK